LYRGVAHQRKKVIVRFHMSMKAKRILYSIFYLVVVVSATPSVIAWWYRITFWLFALFLFWVALSAEEKVEPQESIRTHRLFFACTLFTLIVVRVMPFLHFGGAPFGYDTGIYLRAFEKYLSDPAEGLRPLGLIVQMLSAIGFSTNVILHGGLAVLNIALGFSLYTVSRALFRDRSVALAALFIFTVSISQHEAYIWMFYRMMVAVMLLMVTVALVVRGSWLAIITGGFGGALHPATFLLFGLAYIFYALMVVIRRFFAQENNAYVWKILIIGTAMLLLAVGINFSEFSNELPYLTHQKLRIGGTNPYLSSELSGLYLNFAAFRLSILFYIPFALLGFCSLFRRTIQKWRTNEARGPIFLFSLSAVAFVLILGKMIFYQRYLIILDLFFVIFASITLAHFIEYFKHTKAGQVLLLVFILGFSLIIVYYSSTRQPWIPLQELRELKTASAHIEPDAYGMSTDAYYTPWVYGYLTPRTIAPGYFINYWSVDEWEEFWYKGNDERRQELLARYGNEPIYIFVGKKQAENKPMREFLKLRALQVSDHIWRYQHKK